jgi:UDP-glucose 4-epimerase
VTQLAGAKLEPEFVEPEPGKVRLTSGGPWRLDHALAARVIGWRPRVDMREGIARLLTWREQMEC